MFHFLNFFTICSVPLFAVWLKGFHTIVVQNNSSQIADTSINRGILNTSVCLTYSTLRFDTFSHSQRHHCMKQQFTCRPILNKSIWNLSAPNHHLLKPDPSPQIQSTQGPSLSSTGTTSTAPPPPQPTPAITTRRTAKRPSGVPWMRTWKDAMRRKRRTGTLVVVFMVLSLSLSLSLSTVLWSWGPTAVLCPGPMLLPSSQ